MPDLTSLPPRDTDTGLVNIVVETTKGSRNKFVYDPKLGLFRLKKVLPFGAVFPFDFGFVPSTLGEDGDPLDVLLLMDQPTFPGCLVTARLLGVIQARQADKKGKMIRNDRLVAAAELSHRHAVVHSLKDVDAHELDEIEHFFISYNEQSGKKFKPLGRGGPRRAEKLLEEGIAKHRGKKRKHAA